MKKFILFIVEGKNDMREISAMLKTKYFDQYKDKYDVRFLPRGGDITTAAGSKANNIQKILNDIVMNFRKNGVPYSNIKVQDIQEVIQIVDLDGTFIPRDRIRESEDSRFYYTDDAIYTLNVDGAAGRNRKKAEIINKLCDVKQVGNIPYSIYFMSCNMDHVLFDRRMLEQNEKNRKSFYFENQCRNNPECLKESIFNPAVMAECSYQESWNKIKEGKESLQRHTNFNLFFGDNAKNIK